MRLLIAIDGSDIGRNAVGAAAELFQEMATAEVWLYTVISHAEVAASRAANVPLEAPAPIAERGGGGAPTLSATFEQSDLVPQLVEDRTQAIVRVRAEHVAVLSRSAQLFAPALVHCEVEIDDDPGDAILRFACANEIDLIAMGTHGRTGLAHLLAGSVAEQVIRSAKVPVLVVGPSGGPFAAKRSASPA